VFFFLAGYAIERGFIEEARDAIAFGGLKGARVLRAAPGSLLTRLAPSLARPVGLLARKESIIPAEANDLTKLARRLRGVDLVAHARKCV
jgi:hypothetical protein